MPPISTDDLRQGFLDFFASKGHATVPGASLIPANDPTVLFTTAGMHPLVPYLIGEPHPSGKRICDVQRCIRTLDIDEVGDSFHLTMFEMLGNWSLGDYFKEDAIRWSYEFLTQVLRIDPKTLAVSCFGGDDRFPKMPRDEESAEIWRSIGIPPERIGFIKGGMLESKHNWWGPAGVTGPCGPDTEMFIWVGSGAPRGNPAENGADWMEIWNDVFMQYNKTAAGDFEPLAQKCVDTGMGLERTARVMQGKDNVYETDRMQPIIAKVRSLATSPDIRHERIVTDHIKAATFIIGDGVMPGNVDQGYVLRRLIRRAIRSARQIGISTSVGTARPTDAGQEGRGFCATISAEVIAQYGHVYSHLREKEQAIADALRREEEQFGHTLQEGLKKLERVMEHAKGKVIGGADAFHLYDTYGFPLELTREVAAERGFTLNESDYSSAFHAHQDLSRKGAEQRFSGGLADHSAETTKLHTANHLLNAALRNVLGEHVWQRGSNITRERLRFDFTHQEKMTPEQIAEVERLVNLAIADDLPVAYHVTTPAKAKDEGAIGVFGERYGAEVKVYVIGDEKAGNVFSREICGGPHVARTGMIGSFRVTKEESSSAGVRRIKAVVSGGPNEINTATEAS